MASGTNDRRLLNRQNYAGFDQQGSVDWVRVLASTINFSVEFLVRLSNGGVESLTVVAAEIVLARLKLGPVGEKRAVEAIKGLKVFSSLNKGLWFGFGAKNVIHQLAESSEGLNCIVASSALIESYSNEDTAQILRELFLMCEAPPRLTPSLQQWIALIETCGGAFATSEFGALIHTISRLTLPDDRPHPQVSAEPKLLAEALKKLIAVSNGSLESIQIFGGLDCAWFAAFATWLLDLPVEVRDANRGILWTSYQEPVDPKVVITYMDTATPLKSMRESQIVHGGTAFIIQGEFSTGDRFSYGRVPWKSLLMYSFGKPVHDLLRGTLTTSFGVAMGCAARIFEAVVAEDSNLPLGVYAAYRVHWDYVNPSSYGRGFLNTIRHFLPELGESEAIMEAMEQSQANEYLEAASKFEQAIHLIAAACQCQLCLNDQQGHPIAHEIQEYTFCQVKLVGVIAKLVQILSCLCSPAEILPTKAGLDHLYHWQEPHSPERELWIFRHLIGHSKENVLESAKVLFTGRRKSRVGIAATSDQGLCFYMDILCKPSTTADRCKSIHIVPGRIEWNGNLFNEISESKDGKPDQSTLEYEAVSQETILSTSCVNLKDSSSVGLKIDLILEESVEPWNKGLNASYRITRPDGRRFLVGPESLTNAIANAITAKDCKGKECKQIPPFDVLPLNSEGNIVNRNHLPLTSVPLVVVLSDISAQLVALSHRKSLRHTSDGIQEDKDLTIILQDRQCISCLLMSVMVGAKSRSNMTTRKLCIITW